MPALLRHRLVFRLLYAPVALFARLKFNYTCDSLHEVEGPYLLLPTHNLELDPMLVGVAARRQLYFVASEHLRRKGMVTRLLNYFVQPIYHQKGRAGAHTVMAILKTLRSGSSVCLFPEGNRSFNGLTCPIPPATGKLARRSGAKLITYRFEGQYLTQPRWSTTLRRGRLRGRIVHIYTPEELQAMTDQQVNDCIVRDLAVDTYAEQAKAMIPFRGKHLALGMESTVFACPVCGALGHMHTDSDHLFCDCGFRAKYDAYGYLTDPAGQTYTITGLDRMQQTALAAAVSSAGDEALFSDALTLQQIGEDHQISHSRSVILRAFPDRLELDGAPLPFPDILGMTIYSRNVLVIHTLSQGLHYEFRGPVPFSALKYLYLYELQTK